MQALFVHGMGRTPLSGWPLLWQLRRGGLTTRTFGYVTAWASFPSIKTRLLARICLLASQGDYVLIGHSLGGVLLRAALAELPPSVRQPTHLFLLGSPVHAARLAKRLGNNRLFRALTGDCGAVLGSDARMAAIEPSYTPTTSVVGVRGMSGPHSPFAQEMNDGVVALSEVSAAWLTDQVQIPTLHTLLPASGRAGEVILARIRTDA